MEKPDTPRLNDVARTVNVASRLLRFEDLDHRITAENQATVALAKKHSLVG